MSRQSQSPSDDALIALLRLKRHETPGDEYFDNLLPRIHTRLRAEGMRKSSTMLLAERIGVFFDNLAGGRWLAGGLVAYATVMICGLAILQWSAAPDDPAVGGFRPVSLESGAPVQTQEIRVPFQFKIVPVQPLPPEPAAASPQPPRAPSPR